jgi:RNA polymerase sigma-70 factor, ECF subfamily
MGHRPASLWAHPTTSRVAHRLTVLAGSKVVIDVTTELTLSASPPLIATRTRRAVVEEDAAAVLYRELASAVLGYFRSQRAPEPEDLLGEVFLHVARDINRCRGDAAARRRWVFTIAHHRLVDAWRRQAARPVTTGRQPPERAILDDHLEQLDMVDPALQAGIDTLTDDQRVVVLLGFVADLSLHDVARITRQRVSAVRLCSTAGWPRWSARSRRVETTPAPIADQVVSSIANWAKTSV